MKVMKLIYNINIIIIVSVIFIFSCVSTDAEETHTFLNLFTNQIITKYHVYIDKNKDFMKKKQSMIDKDALLSAIDETQRKDIFQYTLFASICFVINTQYEGYLIEEPRQLNPEPRIYFLLFDRNTGYFIQIIKLAYTCAKEGFDGTRESFIYDLNDDGYPDIITLEYTQTIVPVVDDNDQVIDGDSSIISQSHVLLFTNGRYSEYSGVLPK